MAIGGEYRVTAIGVSHWRALAAGLRIPGDALLARVSALADELPDALDRVVASAAPGPVRDALDRRAAPIRAHAGACRRRLGGV